MTWTESVALISLLVVHKLCVFAPVVFLGVFMHRFRTGYGKRLHLWTALRGKAPANRAQTERARRELLLSLVVGTTLSLLSIAAVDRLPRRSSVPVCPSASVAPAKHAGPSGLPGLSSLGSGPQG